MDLILGLFIIIIDDDTPLVLLAVVAAILSIDIKVSPTWITFLKSVLITLVTVTAAPVPASPLRPNRQESSNPKFSVWKYES